MMAQQTFAITIGRYLDFVDVGERDHEGDEDEGAGVRDLSREQSVLPQPDHSGWTLKRI